MKPETIVADPSAALLCIGLCGDDLLRKRGRG
jgi:hypothetical protein